MNSATPAPMTLRSSSPTAQWASAMAEEQEKVVEEEQQEDLNKYLILNISFKHKHSESKTKLKRFVNRVNKVKNEKYMKSKMQPFVSVFC